jgi:nicotinamidase-related amidase
MSGDPAAGRTALLVVDVQNYFFDTASPARIGVADEILPRINGLIDLAARAGWPVCFTTHRAPTVPGNRMGFWWRHHPEGGQSELFPGLNRPPVARWIAKEHYSAFFQTDLEAILQWEGIRRLVICGVQTHLCVDTTARHAFMLGFQPLVAADACGSSRPEFHHAALLTLGHGFAPIVNAQDLEVQG